MKIKQAIKKVVSFKDLTEKETISVFNDIMNGKCSSSQVAALITALRMKGETVKEITGAAKVMRGKALKIKLKDEKTVVDTCGTGGSGINTFNVSTASAFVLAGCGIKIAKHGNRSVSNSCGSADVLEALGVNINISNKRSAESIKRLNIGFLFAPLYHGAMKYAVTPRKETGIRTIFNVLGPLSNPADANVQVLGVYDEKLTEPIAKVLRNLGVKRAFVVHGKDGLDEITINDRTRVCEVKNNKIVSYDVTPAMFGVKKTLLKAIKGGTAKINARIVRDVLSGSKGPKRDIVLMNSSAALVASGKAKTFRDGMRIAGESIDSGRALEVLIKFIEFTNTGSGVRGSGTVNKRKKK